MKMLTAYTFEIDDPAEAAAEILAQLEPEKHLLLHSVGLLSCHAEFVESGAVKAICQALPFEVVGVTTMGSSLNPESGTDLLALSVLTSDAISFAVALTEPLHEDQEEAVRAAYAKAASTLPDVPAFMIVQAPMLAHVGGERLVRLLDKVSEGVPVFGTVTCDHNFDFSDASVLFQGESFRDRMALVVMSGPVHARFLTISIPEEKKRGQKVMITDSTGNVIREVDGKPVLDYLRSLGLTPESGLAGSKNIPIILDYNDGTQPVARCFYMISPEGHAVCGGDMPMDATFCISDMDYDDVLISADQILNTIAEVDDAAGLLIVSCIVRGVTLGTDQMAEVRKVAERLNGRLPYHLLYSGGEICPVYAGEGRIANRFHNFSFTACLFEA